MYSTLPLRTGTPSQFAAEYLGKAGNGLIGLKNEKLINTDGLSAKNVLAVHFAGTGAQGEAGAVEILYHSPEGVRVLHGNYVYGELDCDALMHMLPVLKIFDCKRMLASPADTKLPEGWGYMYMGAMNHFVVRQQVCDETEAFIEYLMNNDGQSWQIFDAVAWFYGADYSTEPRQFK